MAKKYFWSFLCFEAIWMLLNMLNFSDLSQTLENFSEDSWKILGRLLRENLLGSLLNPKIKYMRRLLEDFALSGKPKFY